MGGKWMMKFYHEKCELIRFGNKYLRDYYLRGYKLKSDNESKYIGVTLQTDLNWDRHIQNI